MASEGEIGSSRKKMAPMVKPWEKSRDWCEEADEVESGVWELAFHHPVGVGGTVAGDTGGVVH